MLYDFADIRPVRYHSVCEETSWLALALNEFGETIRDLFSEKSR